MSLRKIVEHLGFHRTTLSFFPFHHSSRPLSFHSPQPLHQGNQNLDPHSLLKQDPIEICTSLWVKTFSSPQNTSFPNLTGFLSNFDLWLLAYQRSCAHATGTFPPRNAVGTPVLHSLLSLRNAVIRNRFEWNNKTNPFSFVPPMTLPFQSPSLNADSKPLSNPTRPASRTALFRRCYS